MRARTALRVVGAVGAVLLVAMDAYTWPLEPGIPSLQFTFTAGDFNAILDRWGPDGVARFRMHFAMDFPLLIAYALFGHLWVRHGRAFTRLPDAARAGLARLLPTAAVLDAAENLLHLHLLSAAAPPPLYAAAGAAASLKWLLIAIFVLGAALALARKRAG